MTPSNPYPDQTGYGTGSDIEMSRPRQGYEGTPFPDRLSPEPPKPFDAKGSIENMYIQNLGRGSDEGGLGDWLAAHQGGMSLEDINNAIRGSQEGQTYQTGQTINSFYNDALGRDAEQTGMESWRNALQGGSSMDDIRNAIYGSQEAMNYRTNTPVRIDPYIGTPYEGTGGPSAIYKGDDYGTSQQPILDGRAIERGGPFDYETPQQPFVFPNGFNSEMLDENGRVIGYRDPARALQQMDPVMDFVQNIDQQLPFLQRAFQEQLQLLGDPAAAARAVLGSIR